MIDVRNTISENDESFAYDHRDIITENISEVVFITDLDLNTKYVSTSVKKLTGNLPDYHVKRNIIEKIPAETLAMFRNDLLQELELENSAGIDKERKKVIETQYHRSNGKVIDISISVKFTRDTNGKPNGLLGVIRDISDWKRTVSELQKTIARNKALLDAIPDLMFVFDSNCRIIEYHAENEDNDLYTKPESFLGKNIHEVVPPYLAKLTEEKVKAVLDKDIIETSTYDLVLNGKKNYFEARFVRCSNNEVLSIIRNVTQRIEAEEIQRELVKNLTKSQEIAHIGDWSWDLTSDRFYSSDEGLRIMGYPMGSIPNFQDISEQIHPDDRLRVRAVLMQSLQNGEPYQVEMRIFKRDSGELRYIVSMAQIELNSIGKPVKVFGINQDITLRKKAEEEIRRIDEKFSLLVKNIADAIVIIDKNGVQQYVSPSAEKQTGYPITVLQGKSISEIIHPDDLPLVLEKWQLLLSSPNRVVSACYRHINKDKGWVHLEAIGQNLLNEPSVNGVVLCVRDITERIIAEQELQKKNQMLQLAKEKAEESDRLKTAFLANISHEIRTPMNAILGFLDLLKHPNLSEEQINSYIQIVTLSGKRLINTINDIIEISKIETGQLNKNYSEFSVCEIMANNLDLFTFECSKKGISLTITEQILGKESLIISDKYMLSVILSNLINNAIKFTHRGSIEFGNYVQGDLLVFYVKDSGIGIPSHRIEAIFERFVHADIANTRPYEGSGLGLSIAKAYTEALGGKIWVKSELNKGSTFWFSTPFKPILQFVKQVNPLPDIKQAKGQQGKTILIADDDVYSVKLIESILGLFEFNYIVANNGYEAVKLVKENSNVSLILMDIKMPGMNGFDATWEIRKFNDTIPIIAQTAYALVGDKEKALSVGCTDYISKPIDATELYNVIEKYLKVS